MAAHAANRIEVESPRRDFFSGEAAEITSVTVWLEGAVASATLMAQIEVAGATIARASSPCPPHDGKWSGQVNLIVPPVERAVRAILLLRAAAGERVLARAELPIRIHRPRDQFKRDFTGKKFLLIDPKRSMAPVIEFNGIAVSAIEPWQLERAELLPLLIGRDAMVVWTQQDAGHFRQWLEKGGRVVVFAQSKVPLPEFNVAGKNSVADEETRRTALLVFNTPLALALYESAPHRWQPSGLIGAVPLPLPRAKALWIYVLAEPFDPAACCRAVEITAGQGRAVFIQYPIIHFYENEPGARVLWEALLEHLVRPDPEPQLPEIKLEETKP